MNDAKKKSAGSKATQARTTAKTKAPRRTGKAKVKPEKVVPVESNTVVTAVEPPTATANQAEPAIPQVPVDAASSVVVADQPVSAAVELKEVATIPATVDCLRVTAVCANVVIRPGEGDCIRVLAHTPDFWSVRANGSIRERGGVVAEAVALDVMNLSYGTCNGVLRINGVVVVVPPVSQREQLVVEVPASFTGDIDINGKLFAIVKVDIAARKDLEVYASHESEVTVADQPMCASVFMLSSSTLTAGAITCSGAVTLNAETSGKLYAGKITAKNGPVTVRATNSAQLHLHERIRAKVVLIDCAVSAKAHAHNVTSLTDAKVTVSNSAEARVKHLAAKGEIELCTATTAHLFTGPLLARSVSMNASISSSITVDECDTVQLDANASISGNIHVKAGSADRGNGIANISGQILLEGHFGSIVKQRAIGGEVTIVEPKLDATDVFVRAGKRHFDRKYWDDTHIAYASIILTSVIAPSMAAAEGMAEALKNAEFLAYFTRGIPLAYKNENADRAIAEYGVALKAHLTEDEFVNTEKLQQVLAYPEVVAKFQAAFQLFAQAIHENLPQE